MKTGRNDPCPCGSGKKYKKCHLESDLESARVAPPAVTHTPAFTDAPSPAVRAAALASMPKLLSDDELPEEKFRRDFEAAPAEERLGVARAALAAEPEMSGEALFEYALVTLDGFHRARRLDDADAYLDHVEEKYPEAAQEEQAWIAIWRAENALIAKRDARPALLAWAKVAPEHSETVIPLLDHLRYEGKLDDVSAVLRAAWPGVSESGDLVGWALDEWAAETVGALVHQRMEKEPSLRGDEPALRAELEAYGDVKLEWIADYIAIQTGALAPAWKSEDFANEKARPRALERLLMSFERALREEHRWLRARAYMAREAMLPMLLDADDAARERSGGAAAKAKQKKPQKRSDRGKNPAFDLAAFLVPDSAALEAAQQSLFGFFSARAHRAVALFLAVPAWLSFLQRAGLTDQGATDRGLRALAKFGETLRNAFGTEEPLDPALYEDLLRGIEALPAG